MDYKCGNEWSPHSEENFGRRPEKKLVFKIKKMVVKYKSDCGYYTMVEVRTFHVRKKFRIACKVTD